MEAAPINNGDAGAPEESLPFADNSSETCIACGEPSNALQRLDCGHRWDGPCLVSRVKLAVACEVTWPTKCCGGAFTIETIQQLRSFLGEELVQRCMHRFEEVETPRGKRIYCSEKACSEFVGQQTAEPHLQACRVCSLLTCLHCATSDREHGEEVCTPRPPMENHDDLIRAGQMQKCPECPEVIELKEACHHMTCLCGAQFCYQCGKVWKTCPCGQYPGQEDIVPAAPGPAARPVMTFDEFVADRAARADCYHPFSRQPRERVRCHHCTYFSNFRISVCDWCGTAVCYYCFDRLNLRLGRYVHLTEIRERIAAQQALDAQQPENQ